MKPGSMIADARQVPTTEITAGGSPIPTQVLVNYQSWLPLTENWLHTQLAGLPPSIEPTVVCGRTRGLDAIQSKALEYRPAERLAELQASNLVAFEQLPLLERLGLLCREARVLKQDLSKRAALLAWVARHRGSRLVHSHFGYTGWRSARALQRLGLAHVVSFYGVDMSALPQTQPVWRKRYLDLFRRVERVFCEGPHMRMALQALGCPAHKLQVHHLGVDLASLPFQPLAWEPGMPLRVLIAASFREKKGIPVAIKALARLQDRIPLRLTLVGDAGAGAGAQAEKLRIIRALADSGLGSVTRQTGYLPRAQLLELARQHHVFLHPSRTAADGDSEGGAPVALMEMAATGLILVSTRHADIPEIVPEGRCSLLADEGDVDGLVQHLLWLSEHPNSWQALRAAARERIELEFDSHRQGRRLAACYHSILADGHATRAVSS